MIETNNKLLSVKYDELYFMNIGDMLLINPKENPTDEPAFFIKESQSNIKKMISGNTPNNFEFKHATYNISGIMAILLMVRINQDDNLIYGQWINKFNKKDRANIMDINFKDKISFCVINGANEPRIHFKLNNVYKGKLGNYLKHDKYSQKWSNEMFEDTVIYINSNFSRKDEMYNFE